VAALHGAKTNASCRHWLSVSTQLFQSLMLGLPMLNQFEQTICADRVGSINAQLLLEPLVTHVHLVIERVEDFQRQLGSTSSVK